MQPPRYPRQSRRLRNKLNHFLLIHFGKSVEIGNVWPLTFWIGAGETFSNEFHTQTLSNAATVPCFLALTVTLSKKSALALGMAESNSRAPNDCSHTVTSARLAGVTRPAVLCPVSVVGHLVAPREIGAERVIGEGVPNKVEQCGT